MSVHVSFALAIVVAFAGCTRLPRPPVLSEADAVLQTQSAKTTGELAPQAFARAEQLREQAEAAYDSNQLELAAELGTHTLAALQRAHVQARLVAANERLATSKHELANAREELAALAHKQRSVSAQVETLELRIKVVRDAEVPADIEPASPKREAARRAAAKALLANARLLCVASRLLDGKPQGREQLLVRITNIETTVETGASPVPIADAMRLRADCLNALTEVRRAARQSKPASDPADQLISQLDRAVPRSAPTRDDRGVVVAFSDFFAGETLTDEARARIAEMVQIAQANPKLPLLVVMHSARRSAKAVPARLQDLKAALATAGASNTPVYSFDDRLPASVLPVKGSKLKDERVEFVFVAR